MIADTLSRSVVDRHDWMLSETVFRRLEELWGPLEVDLFATKMSTQLPRYFSWKPDPQAEAVNAFAQTRSTFRGYANPPWSLIGRCIQQIKQQKAAVVLVTPLWISQPWFAELLPLCVDRPRLLPVTDDLMTPMQGSELPFPDQLPRPVAWFVSGNTTSPQGSQKALLDCCCPHGEPPPARTMSLPGTSGKDGDQTTAETLFLPL